METESHTRLEPNLRQLGRIARGAGYLAEVMVIENAHATAALKQCWKQRLQILKKDLGKRRGANARTTLDSTRGIVLVEAHSSGIGLLNRNEAVDHAHIGHLLGEAIEYRPTGIRSRL